MPARLPTRYKERRWKPRIGCKPRWSDL